VLFGHALQQLPHQIRLSDQGVAVPDGGDLFQLLRPRGGVVARLDGGDLDSEVRLGLGDAPDGGVEEGPVALGAVDEVDDPNGVLVRLGG
jgi:hypothetical protein